MKRFLIAALFCAAFVSVAQAQTASESEALTRAGELRTLSQRIAKLYFQNALDLNATAARRTLNEAIGAFDRSLQALGSVAMTASMQRSYAKTTALWGDCRQIANAPPNKDAAAKLGYLADNLMIATGKLAFLLEGNAAGTNARLVDLSMRQSMLAQRLAKVYLARRLLGSQGASLVDVEQARGEFKTALRELNTAPDNTQQALDALELAAAQWIFFEKAIQEGDSGERQFALNVSTTSERIGESMNDVVASYDAAMRVAAKVAGNAIAGKKAETVARRAKPY